MTGTMRKFFKTVLPALPGVRPDVDSLSLHGFICLYCPEIAGIPYVKQITQALQDVIDGKHKHILISAPTEIDVNPVLQAYLTYTRHRNPVQAASTLRRISPPRASKRSGWCSAAASPVGTRAVC